MVTVCGDRNRNGRLYLTSDIDGIKLAVDLGISYPNRDRGHGSNYHQAWTAYIDAQRSRTSNSGNGELEANVLEAIHKALSAPREIPFLMDIAFFPNRRHRP